MFRGLFYNKELTILALIVIAALPMYTLFMKRYIRKIQLQQLIGIIISLSYLIVIIYFTIIRKQPQNQHLINLHPFWSYERFYEADYQWQIYMNILLFVPFGFFLSVTMKSIRGWHIVIYTIALASMIEASQYFLRLGLCEFDDVFHNTLGAWIGYLYYKGVTKLSTDAFKRFNRRMNSNG